MFLDEIGNRNRLIQLIQDSDFDTFDMLISMFAQPDGIGLDANELWMQTKTKSKETLLHLAVIHYVEKSDDRFMKSLWDVNFPMYEEDLNGDIPAFALALWDIQEEFKHGLQILIDAGFDINHSNSSGKELIEFMSEYSITVDRVEFMKKCGLAISNLDTVQVNIRENEYLSEDQKEQILSLL